MTSIIEYVVSNENTMSIGPPGAKGAAAGAGAERSRVSALFIEPFLLGGMLLFYLSGKY